jgi:Flp pilus assembly protein TadD
VTDRANERSSTELAANLGVDAVLEGSVRWAEGGRVRVVSRLVDGRSGQTMWSEVFDRRITEVDSSVLSIQSEVSRKIAVMLKGELSEVMARQLAVSGPLDAARSYYLAGRYYWSVRTDEGLSRSVEAYQKALKVAPSYAPAYSGLADSYTLQGILDLAPRTTALAAAKKAALKAVELDGRSAEARASLGYVLKNEFRWKAAEDSFRRALTLRPDFPTAHHWYGILLTQEGKFPEALAEIKAAIALDPTAIAPRGQLAVTLELARRYDEAIDQAERVIEMDPLHPIAYVVLAEAYAYKGDYVRALAAMDRRAKAGFIGIGEQVVQGNLGFIHAMAGHRKEAEVIVRGLERRESTGEPVAAAIASIHGAMGETDRAFEFLERSYARNELDLGYLKVEPRWDSLRNDPRFDGFMKKVGLLE